MSERQQRIQGHNTEKSTLLTRGPCTASVSLRCLSELQKHIGKKLSVRKREFPQKIRKKNPLDAQKSM